MNMKGYGVGVEAASEQEWKEKKEWGEKALASSKGTQHMHIGRVHKCPILVVDDDCPAAAWLPRAGQWECLNANNNSMA